MKQITIILFLLILIVPTQIMADPWLMSQQYEPAEIQPDCFYIVFDDNTLDLVVSPAYDMLGRPFLLVDVGVFGLKPGPHVVRAQAVYGKEVSGMSEALPFSWPWKRFSSPRLSIHDHRPVLNTNSPLINNEVIRPPTGLSLF